MGTHQSKLKRQQQELAESCSTSAATAKLQRSSGPSRRPKCCQEIPEVVILPDILPDAPRAPPMPPCKADMIATVEAGNYDVVNKAEIVNILNLVRSIFEAPIALIATYGDKKVYIRNALGMPKAAFPYDVSICAWLLSTENPTNLVVEDIDKDERFKKNCVLIQNGIKAYVGAPLVASNGHRLGSLAFLDVKPRRIGASMCQLLNNFSELVVRELEQDIALQLQQQTSGRLQQVYSQLVRGLDCFQQALLLVEATKQRWQVLHCNQAWSSETGVPKELTQGRSLWGLFQHTDGSQLGIQTLKEAQDSGCQFSIPHVCTRDIWDGRPITLTFRSASQDTVDDYTQRIGVPAAVSSCATTGFVRDFYFITVTFHTPSPTPSSSCTSLPSLFRPRAPAVVALAAPQAANKEPLPLQLRPCPVPGLRVCSPLAGSSSNVYRGTWYGSDVAIKVLLGGSYSAAQELRAALGSQLTHPNVVATLKVATCPGAMGGCNGGMRLTGDSAMELLNDTSMSHSDSSLADSAASMEEGGGGGMETWVVMELCDKGPLLDALEQGLLHSSNWGVVGACTSHLRVLATALDVARALAYLHERGVVHGDLCATAVLLTSRGCTGEGQCRGFVAKVGNFRRAHNLQHNSQVLAPCYSHHHAYQAPEVLQQGTFSKASDVYAFGVLLWQLHTTCRPWPDKSAEELQIDRPPLPFPPRMPAEYQALVRSCLAQRAEARPAFQALCGALQQMLLDSDPEACSQQSGVHTEDYMDLGASSFIQSL